MGVLDIFYWEIQRLMLGILSTADMDFILDFAEHENNITVAIYITYIHTCISHWIFKCHVAV